MKTIECCGKILSDGFEYCPRCGRRTGRLATPVPKDISLGVAESEFHITLENIGPGALPIRISSLSDNLMSVGDGTVTIPRWTTRSLSFRLKHSALNSTGSVLPAFITVVAGDAERVPWWKRISDRDVTFEVRLKVARAAQVVTPAKTLLFTESGTCQCLEVYNLGDATASVVVHVPDGFQISESESPSGSGVLSFDLKGRQHMPLWVKSLRNAGSEPKFLTISAGGIESTVALQQVQNRRPTIWKPPYIIGIDFGTRNTSLFLRNVETSAVTPVTEQPRFPSVLYVDPNLPGSAQIGMEAIEAWNDPNGSNDAFLVESIKTLVRLQEEKYVDQYGPEWTIARLLRLYLGALKRLIDTRLDALNVHERGNLLYVFTLPVLDAAEQFAAQQKRMFDAAVAAGFPDDPEIIWFLSEPQAAALYVANALPEIAARKDDIATRAIARNGIGGDTKICVVDAGGGTTDVCIGTIQANAAGRWEFRTIHTLALNRNEPSDALERFSGLLYPKDNARRRVPLDSQVGGNVIDYEIAGKSIGNLQVNDTHFPASPWNAFYPEISQEFLRVEKFLHGIKSLKEELSTQPGTEIDIKRQIELVYDFQTRFDVHKAGVDALGKGNTVFRYSTDVVPVVQEIWSDPNIGARLRTEVTSTGCCDYVVPIGGTTLLPEFTRQIEQFTQTALIELPAEDRVTAVARGAVWAYDAKISKMLPVKIWLQIEVSDMSSQPRAILKPYQPIIGMTEFDRPYSLPDGGEMTIKLEWSYADARMPLAQWNVRSNGLDSIRVTAKPIDECTVRVSIQCQDSAAEPIWEVHV